MELSRYIVLNLIRAGMLDDVSLYKWSSFRAMAELGIAPDCLSVTWILGRFGDIFILVTPAFVLAMVMRYSHLAPDYIAGFAENSARSGACGVQNGVQPILKIVR